MRHIVLTALIAISLLPACNGATELPRQAVDKNGDRGFKYATLTRDNRHRQYAYFIPIDYNPATRYPVIIFLHGQGEGAGAGPGDGRQLTVGLGPFVERKRYGFPFVCIFPQSNGNWNPDSEYATDVLDALDDIASKYSIDLDRVFLTGLSTGGYGTYAIAAGNPTRFAALVPMGTSSSPLAYASQLTRIPIRAYCSQSGDILAGTNDNDMVTRINQLGGHAQFIQTPTNGHDCWEYVYGHSDLFDWLQQQHRPKQNR
jgi:predicted peptidase